MPNANFAADVISGYHEATDAERQRRDKNNLAAADFLLRTGRVRDFNELLPLIGETLEPTGGMGRGRKGKGGATDILAQLLNPAIAAGPAAPAAAPSTGAPGASAQPGMGEPSTPQGGLLLTDSELAQRQTEQEIAAQRRKFAEQLDQAKQLGSVFPDMTLQQRLEAVGFKMPSSVAKWQPGTTAGSALPGNATDIYGEPIDPKKFYKTGLQFGQQIFAPTTSPAAQTDKDLEARVRDYVSQGLSEDQAHELASQDRIKERQLKVTRAVGLIKSTDLTTEEKRRVLAGELTFKDAITLAQRMAANNPDISPEDMGVFAREIYQKFGPAGGSRSGAGAAVSSTAVPTTAAPAAGGGASTPAGSEGGATPGAGVNADVEKARAAQTLSTLWNRPFKPAKLSSTEAQMVNTGETAMDLSEQLMTVLEKANLTKDLGVPASAEQRFKSFQYGQGITKDLFDAQMRQLAGAVRTYALSGVLRGAGGRPNVQLQNIILSHIPNPDVDAPGLMYEKTQTLMGIIRDAIENTLVNASMTPDQVAAQLIKKYGPAGTPVTRTDTGNAALRTKARQALVKAGYKADDATIDTFLKNNPGFK